MAATLPHRKTDWTPFFLGAVLLLAITFVACAPALFYRKTWGDRSSLLSAISS